MAPIHPLISIDELADRLGDPALRVVDCRWVLGQPGAGRVAYDAGHVPGALFLDVDGDLAGPVGSGPGRHPLPEVGAFVRGLESVGIGDEHLVVAYDDVGGWVAARLWWMLDVLGHERVQVLDGGWTAWVAAGGPTTTDLPAYSPATLDLADAWARTIDRDGLRARLGDVALIDARAAPRYRGETEPIDPVAGHIPTARNAPTGDDLAPDGRFRSPSELADRYRAIGIGGGSMTVTSCGSGVSACHHALAMRVAGLPDPILYPGSYSDWTRSGLPVATGPEPGEPPS